MQYNLYQEDLREKVFGYLTAYTDKLNEEDRETYQAYYCGLCEALGRKFGKKSQLVLTYDLVFLAILYNALYEQEESTKTVLCAWKGKKVPKVSTEALDFAADMNLMLAYHNFSDKVYDSSDRRAAIAVKLLEKEYVKTAGKWPGQAKALEKYMLELHEIENSHDPNPDAAANATGRMTAEVFLRREDEFAKYLRGLFFYLGKFIYLIDAYEDMLDDFKTKAYNPYEYLAENDNADERIRGHLESVMGECVRWFECLPLFRHREILRNILYSGVWLAYGKTYFSRHGEKEQ